MVQSASKIKFAHISPVSFMELAESKSGINLVLAHLIGDNAYTRFYRNSSKETIMDNGAFELGQSMDPEKLIDLGHKVKADYLVLPDYPGQPASKTIESAEYWIPEFKKNGFKTFFVPQSGKGDIEGYMESWKWALQNENIDLIGNSILGAPIALNSNKYNRISARFEILRRLADLDIKVNKRIHMLGMLDTVREISLCNVFSDMIYSWDSSVAVWYGMRQLEVNKTYEKYEESVDFNETSIDGSIVIKNIDFVNLLLEK